MGLGLGKQTDKGLFNGTLVLCSDLPALALLGPKRTALMSRYEATAGSGVGKALSLVPVHQTLLYHAHVALRYSRLLHLNLL